jgi:hypothetical protein
MEGPLNRKRGFQTCFTFNIPPNNAGTSIAVRLTNADKSKKSALIGSSIPVAAMKRRNSEKRSSKSSGEIPEERSQ